MNAEFAGMTSAEKIAYKNRLKQFCELQITARISVAKNLINEAQEAANNEEKSSAGDKYETGRAMGHLQKDMHASQLAAYLKELAALQAVNTGVCYEKVVTGSFIETASASFFIATGLGKQVFDNNTVIFLSPQAPLTAILQNKKQGDGFVFNGEKVVVKDVF